MNKKGKSIFLVLIFSLIFLLLSSQLSIRYWNGTNQDNIEIKQITIKSAGFWNNFTFIHITNLNWTDANQTEWCSGSGSIIDPYLIENMVINATDSPIGCGILIENSINAYFTIENVTIFGGLNGIELENTNNGAIIDNILLDNLDSGISMINADNNTLLDNHLINNGLCGINLTSYCYDNRILANIIKNEASNLQDTGIHLRSYCNNNDILGNLIYDNNVYGINIENNCEENVISNNTITNIATNYQDYGIRLHNDCHQSTITSNIIKDLNNYGIYMVTSDQNSITDNQIINCGSGMYMLIDLQSVITDNIISGGSYGIIMSACDGGEFADNFINETLNYAIRIIINSDNNEFHDNIIKDNINNGIQLDDPSDVNNKFYKNSFISNGIHAYDNGTATSWNYLGFGNYWDNYSGVDADYDHIGDTPYNITGAANATDSFPLFDHGVPVITINTPTSSEYGEDAPDFNIFINDPYIYSMWYIINNSGTRHYFTQNGTIDGFVWDSLVDGDVSIRFYTQDIAWNLGSNSIELVKNTSSDPGDPNPGDGAPPLDLLPIIIICVIIISAILLTGILIRGIKKKGIPETGLPEKQKKSKKSKMLNEEQLTEAQYFKDITSIVIIIAIHKDSGLALSKIALHGGIGLDENLFTGFISAMGSFKNELAKQMGLEVREEGGDNIIQYNEFTITIMDGEFLRLGLVSHSSLGAQIKQQCGQVLRDYEIKHIDKLKNFDGEILAFKDFKNTIETGLIMNLNRKFKLNFKLLNKYETPEPLKRALHEITLRTEEFFLLEIVSTLRERMNLPEQEAYLIVYEAYNNEVFMSLS